MLGPVLLAGALAACGRGGDARQDTAVANASAPVAANPDDHIPCATSITGAFAPDCTVDRAATARGLMLTLRHPDGHFHRLLVTTDGRGVVAADGAEPARVSPLGPDQIEVAIGRDRYRLPATVTRRARP